jgi:hypothetical protein
MESFMKNASIYSILFALLMALNPLQIKADTPTSTLSALRDPLSIVFLGLTLGYGIGSAYYFKECWKSRNAWHHYKAQAELLSTVPSDGADKGNNDTEKLNNLAKKELLDMKICATFGVICLVGVGIFGKACYLAIKAAK